MIHKRPAFDKSHLEKNGATGSINSGFLGKLDSHTPIAKHGNANQ